MTPSKRVLGSERQLHRHRVGAEAVDDRLHRRGEVGADAVHLVDERDARHRVLVGLAPDGLALGLHAGDRVEERDGAVEHAERPLHLDRKVNVPGSIDDVDAIVAPERSRRGRGDRDAALLLLDHPVHGGGTLVHLADLVRLARVEQDALGRGRLAGIDVSHDADVTNAVELVHRGHAGSLLCLYYSHDLRYQR